MPLLKKKPFERAPIPGDIHDDEEVFYCAATNEIFRDYEEFSERMFLCNSMVWTCCLTGKTNLTYPEALESEENAKNSLKEFPAELKTPILFLATKTKRTAFGDMAEDVFAFAKDRFFIGENIETSFTGSKWKDSHVLQVVTPEKNSAPVQNGNVPERRLPLSPSSYKYEIEHLDADDKDISEIMIVDSSQMRRKKGSFSREKCKLFLKQYVEQNEQGVFVIKPSIVESFNLSKISFDQIFNGQAPEFDMSKKLEKVANGKKVRQESLHKFLTKNANFDKSSNNVELFEKMRKREEELKLQEQQNKEKKLQMKQKKKEQNLMLAGMLKNWNKPKEDLELVDQQVLGEGTPVKLKVPDEYVGDVFMVMEFANSFSKLLRTRSYFPGGLTVEVMERALTKNEVAGPLIDLFQMLLGALFYLQDQENTQCKMELHKPSKLEEDGDNMNFREATRQATIASSWCKTYQGIALTDLPMYSLTTSELLRLHLLESGAVVAYSGAKWRYAQRGGYTSEDDPGLYFKLHSPHILRSLQTHNVVELPIGDKLKILSCLIDQILTYADVRDIVEERMEQMKQAKLDYKMTLTAERRREQEFLTARFKLKKLTKTDPKAVGELEALEAQAEKKKAANERKLEELRKVFYEKEVVMGQDRAFRRYLKLESIPGFFVDCEEENPGACLSSIVEQMPHLVNANRTEVLAHLKTMMQDPNSSDKENSPSKSPKKLNGGLNGLQKLGNERMMCSSDPTSCVVHSSNERTKWCFFPDRESLSQLTESLNKRGIRENVLLKNLRTHAGDIEALVARTPGSLLNPDLPRNEEQKMKSLKQRYEDANMGYSNDMTPPEIFESVLVENILELEEKLYFGNVGKLCVNDRDRWRECLQNGNYAELEKSFVRKEAFFENAAQDQPYQDPGHFLAPSDVDNNNDEVVRSLAVALAQVGQSVDSKFLKKPLGHVETSRSAGRKKQDVLYFWTRSLLAATSFSQIFLHYSTLDSCILLRKSLKRINCRICKRLSDSENMLLCDECNGGHHLYCLKPKLTSVPPGDWYCDKCRKTKPELAEEVKVVPKKRPIFRDEEIEEEEESLMEEVEEEEEDDEHDLLSNGDVCKTCGSGGELLTCDTCSLSYHIECVEPPLRRAPRGPWFCMSCKKHSDRKRRLDPSYGAVVQRTAKMNGQRRCAAQALFKIHDFAKSLRELSDSDSSEDEVISKRSSRRDDNRSDLPLHNSALHAVLSEVMKDSNAWPFLRPVQKTEVPDYYDVITKPMDFGTIKYKLNMGEYHEDAQFMSDALLVFQNCNTYNHTDDDVYKCGVELLRHFQKKCRELGLELPEELDYESRPKKKIRTK